MRIPIHAVHPDTGEAEIIGWVHEVRDLGGLTFLLIRDRTGIIQVTIPKKKASESVLAAVKAVSRESVVRISGPVKPIEKAPGGRETRSGIIRDNQPEREPDAARCCRESSRRT